jgi:hypothetical protein
LAGSRASPPRPLSPSLPFSLFLFPPSHFSRFTSPKQCLPSTQTTRRPPPSMTSAGTAFQPDRVSVRFAPSRPSNSLYRLSGASTLLPMARTSLPSLLRADRTLTTFFPLAPQESPSGARHPHPARIDGEDGVVRSRAEQGASPLFLRSISV